MPSGFHRFSRTASSNATADSSVNFAEGQAPSTLNDSNRAVMARLAEYRDDVSGATATTGSADAYVFASYQTLTALVDGYKITFTCHASNTTTSTINVDSMGAKPLRALTGVELSADTLKTGSIYSATYDSSAQEWLLHGYWGNFIGASSTVALTQVSITGGTALTAPDAADLVPLYDDSATANRKVTLTNFFKSIATLAAETSPATDDEILLYDLSATTADKITLSNLFKVINAFTAITSLDNAADYAVVYDATDSLPKKVLISSLATATGGRVLINSQNASASTEIDFNASNAAAAFDGTYARIIVEISGLRVSVDDTEILMRVGTGAGPTYQTSGYAWVVIGVRSVTASIASNSTSDAEICISSAASTVAVGSGTGERYNATIEFDEPDATVFPKFIFRAIYDSALAGPEQVIIYSGLGVYSSATAITALRFLPDGGAFTSGHFAIYGDKK